MSISTPPAENVSSRYGLFRRPPAIPLADPRRVQLCRAVKRPPLLALRILERLDPNFDGGDLFIGEPAAGGHLVVGFLVADGAEEEAVFQVASDDRGAVGASLHDSFYGIELEIPFEFARLLRMAVVAVVGEEGLYFFVKQCGWVRGLGSGGEKKEREQEGKMLHNGSRQKNEAE